MSSRGVLAGAVGVGEEGAVDGFGELSFEESEGFVAAVAGVASALVVVASGACGCPKSCRGWSGGLFVFVDEAIAAGRSDESKGQRVVSRVVVGGGVSGRSLV